MCSRVNYASYIQINAHVHYNRKMTTDFFSNQMKLNLQEPTMAVTPATNGLSNHSIDQASKLLDFSQKLDIDLLDLTVSCLYGGEGQQVSFPLKLVH